MNVEQLFEEQVRHLKSFDFKSELLFDALLESEIEDVNIVVKPNGLFYRNFRKDMMRLASDPIKSHVVNIDVSRDGFYDILPENITHNNQDGELYGNAVKEFKRRKIEEKEARNFFNPLENELFRFRHAVEKYESVFLSNLNTNKVSDTIRTILAVDDAIPDNYVVKLYYALLKQNQVREQNIEKIIQTLEEIIQEKVNCTVSNIKLSNTHDVNAKKEDMILGINTTLESNEKIFLKKYNFTFGPLKKSENLELFFKNELMETFITTFFNLFLPFHIQYSFEIKLNGDDEQFVINDDNFKSRLGISTVI